MVKKRFKLNLLLLFIIDHILENDLLRICHNLLMENNNYIQIK